MTWSGLKPENVAFTDTSAEQKDISLSILPTHVAVTPKAKSLRIIVKISVLGDVLPLMT